MSFVVNVSENKNLLSAEIFSDIAVGCQFAFYVIKDGVREYVQWYSDDNSIDYNTGGFAGVYRIIGFVKNSAGESNFKYSRFIIKLPPAINVSELVFNRLSDGPLQISANGFDFPCMYFRGSTDRLFVLLSGAVDRAKASPPVFNRWTWASRFPGHVLCISDPTLILSETLRLGWYLGTSSRDVTSGLEQLVVAVAKFLNIDDDKIITYGSSGGGFTALALAARINGSTAVAINAQTIATDYDPKSVREMLDVCFDGLDPDEALRQFPERLSMVCVFSAENNQSRVLLVQNTVDKHHFDKHFSPLATELGLELKSGPSRNNRHYALVYEHESGHGPEPEEMVNEIIRKAVELSQC